MSSRYWFVVLACLLGFSLWAADLRAQPGPGGGFDRGMGGVGTLLMSESVQQEIDLKAEQLEELQAMRDQIRDEMRDRMQGRFQGFRDMSDDERREAMEDMRTEMEVFQQDIEKRLGGVLTSSQMSRLQQIDLQQQMQRGGTQVLLRGALAEKLGITEEQQEEMRKKAQEEQEKLQKQIQQLQQESRERVLAVLTDTQRAQLKELTGEKFDMPQPQGPFGQRGGDRQGRRGGRPPGGDRP